MNQDKKDKKCIISFDIGHSSIGWAVLSSSPPPLKGNENPLPVIEGCGSVIFPKDDCLASQRRDHRRARRNIRATRQRIERLKALLAHLQVLNSDELDIPGHAAPHLLAAKALISDQPSLTWLELWHVIRWYAHNRGYDGNSRWAKHANDLKENTEKEAAAHALMKEHNTESMAETICAVLDIDLRSDKISSEIPFKTLNTAFPREIVRGEVRQILDKHKGHLAKLDQDFIDTLIAPEGAQEKRAWETIPVREIKLPKRYFGGLLFGQLIPRFDNRIIAKCSISGEKVPNKSSREFRYYRWAMLLANIKVDGKPLTAEQRQAVHADMEEKGKLTPTELKSSVGKSTGSANSNISASFEIHPDSKDALVLDPALAYFHSGDSKPKKNTTTLAHFWQHLSEHTKNKALGRWKKGRPVTLQWMVEQCSKEGVDASALEFEIEQHFSADQKKKKPTYPTKEHFLRRKELMPSNALTGRAPFSRRVMQEVLDFVLNTDRHPETATHPAGPIYRSKEILQAERDRPIDELTNNHLIRQRLTILLRLVDDIIDNYCGGDAKNVSDIVVEVARDLQEYSSMTAKEMAGELTKRLKHFKSAEKYLEENAPELDLTGSSLIRRCRIAMDMEWLCPYTGHKYCAQDLPYLDKDHIIPRSKRQTDSLDSLVLTFPEVNKMKSNRTGMEFIKACASRPVEGKENLSILTQKRYKDLIKKKLAKDKYKDDKRRQENRKRLMLVEADEVKEEGFTEGSLTVTSHLNRLSARQLEKRFVDPLTGETTANVVSIPGQFTAEARKAWKLLHTLDQACPECKDKNKTEIRNITHLHHAVDAATLALIRHYFPDDSLFQKFQKAKNKGARQTAVHKDIPKEIKNQLARKLAEKRVVQHIPADQSGAKLEQNPWRVLKIQGDPNDPQTMVTIRQRATTVQQNGRREFKPKEKEEKVGKLVGLKPGKLKKNQSVLIIGNNYGIALTPEPQIIPFHKVHERLADITSQNKGKKPQILRNGMLVRISNWEGKNGVWRIFSCKNSATGLKLDLGAPDSLKFTWGEVSLNSLIKKRGLEILNSSLTMS